MKKHSFDTNVQLLKYNVLKEVANYAYEDNLIKAPLEIPEKIVPGPEANMRCCIYKERAIVSDRIKMAMGGDQQNDNVIEVLKIACDECPVSHYSVGNACRGCIAHWCENTCSVGAISIVNHMAVIDSDKCIECGKCAKVCPYGAISKHFRPCEKACKVNAISMDENKKAVIDPDRCIECGACVYKCPFGAIMDKSFILDVIRILRESENNSKYHVYAVIAPAIASQFSYATVGKVVAGIKKLGFFKVFEAALGADMVANKESLEFKEKGFLTTSCCPAFVSYIKKNFSDLNENISHNLSPMAEIAAFIKKKDLNCKIVFIGPCTAKKKEIKLDEVKDFVDSVLTFEELQALFGSRKISVELLDDEELDNASYFGRIFARSGGVAEAVGEAIKEHGLESEIEYKPIVCDGIEKCKVALIKKQKGMLTENFVEGMVCDGGCIGGSACLTHQINDKNEINKYAQLAKKITIKEAVDDKVIID